MVNSDQLEDDPFFRLPADSDWNACIGKQGTEENYLDGYIEAAIELVAAIIEKKMWEKRDTVVLPILYNARHAIELSLKYAINRLAKFGLLQHPKRRNHDIQSYLTLLEQADLGDTALRACIRDLKPFVTSLSRIDEDGQELRYHTNRDDDPSLSNYSLANLEVIRDSLTDLSKTISTLKYRTGDFIEERATRAYTKRLSRSDLMSIAKTLPALSLWKESVFEEKRQQIQSQFNLSNREFYRAIWVIRSNREMKALVGGETTLLYLPDHLIISIAEKWRKLHPRRIGPAIVEKVDAETIKKMKEHYHLQGEIVSALEPCLTDQQLAELDAICSLGRHGGFPETHEERVQQTIERHQIEADTCKQITNLVDKTNFLDALIKALRRLGRPSLAAQLSEM